MYRVSGTIVCPDTGVLEQLIDHVVYSLWEFGNQGQLFALHGLYIDGLVVCEDAEDCDCGVLGYRKRGWSRWLVIRACVCFSLISDIDVVLFCVRRPGTLRLCLSLCRCPFLR